MYFSSFMPDIVFIMSVLVVCIIVDILTVSSYYHEFIVYCFVLIFI